MLLFVITFVFMPIFFLSCRFALHCSTVYDTLLLVNHFLYIGLCFMFSCVCVCVCDYVKRFSAAPSWYKVTAGDNCHTLFGQVLTASGRGVAQTTTDVIPIFIRFLFRCHECEWIVHESVDCVLVSNCHYVKWHVCQQVDYKSNNWWQWK